MKSRRLLRSDVARIWDSALRAVAPESAICKFVRRKGRVLRIRNYEYDLSKFNGVWVIGAGKAAASMAKAIESILGSHLTGGLLVTKYGHSLPLSKLEVIEAGHPLPDENSMVAAEKMISFVKNRIVPGGLVLCLLSGGASSLLVSPAEGITLEDKLVCTHLLLNAGASIQELNAIRKHLSNLKGGGLARLMKRKRFVSLILSDVVGDDVSTIASGPLTADSTTFADCIEIFEKLKLSNQIPPAVRHRFDMGVAGLIAETPKAGDPVFQKSETVIIGSNSQACAAAAQAATHLGYNTMVLTSRLEGDNEEAARFHMNVASEIAFESRPLRRPACIVSGGETTVRVSGRGTGGRNQEFSLHCAVQLAHLPAPCLVASLGTDGTDGPTDAAGAISDNTTLMRSAKYGARFLNDSLDNNDSYGFFKRLGDLIITGPTRTNVMDLHIVLIG